MLSACRRTAVTSASRPATRDPPSSWRTGGEYPVKLIDVSISGAAFTSDARLAIGTPVTLGRTVAHVVRVFGNGTAVEFARPFSLDSNPSDLQL